jgi:glycosyltransferase involved in cell wall biosynthesis
MLLTIYSILIFFYWAFLLIWLIVNGRKIIYLSSIKIPLIDSTPSVVIVIAVRNEAYALREALTSVCNLDYKNYKVVVVNDRSTDGSGEILSELATKFQRLKIINIETLPAGWLGKNHALFTGAAFSNEEYILFTDADVLYNKNALNKAMHYCLKNNLDHLAILPGMISPSAALTSVLMTFVIILTAVQRPWAARKKTSKTSMGVGAFNLVKRSIYEKTGTHKSIAMRPDDDLKLAAAIKDAGGAADVLYGQDEIQLEWYASVKEFINGLMKNIFSGFKYNIVLAAAGALGTLFFFVLPLPLILVLGNCQERILGICILIFQILLYGNMPGAKGKWWYGLMIIYSGIVITYIIARATIINTYDGGIYWRDTFYSLDELKKNK